jgi:hypothetical protein
VERFRGPRCAHSLHSLGALPRTMGTIPALGAIPARVRLSAPSQNNGHMILRRGYAYDDR